MLYAQTGYPEASTLIHSIDQVDLPRTSIIGQCDRIRVKIGLERSGVGIIAPSMLLVQPDENISRQMSSPYKLRAEVRRAMM